MADNNVIGIKFGVAGGKSFIAGSSGALIKEQLEWIASKVKLKINIDEKYFKGQLNNLKKEIDSTLGKLDINLKTKNAVRVTGGQDVKEQEIGYESLRKTLENLYNTKVRLLKTQTTDEGKQATVNGELLERQQKRLEESYNSQLEKLREIGAADAEQSAEIEKQIQQAEELRAALEAVYSTQKNDLNAPKEEQVTYESLRETLEELYKTKSKLLKASIGNDGQAEDVGGELLMRQQQELEKSYQEQLTKLREIGAADSSRTEEIERQIKEAEQLKTSLEGAYNTQAAAIKQPKYASQVDLAKLGLKAQSLYTDNGFDKIISRSTEALALVDEYNRKVREALASPDGIVKPAELNKLNAEFLRTEEALKRIGAQTNTVGNKIREAFSTRVIQRVAQMLLFQIMRALRQVYQNVADINKSMTELKIVTQATSDQIDKAADSIAKAARRIGATVSDLIDSTTVYARLGYTLADAQVLAEKTTMYANVSGVNVNEATTNITGLIKAFNIGADGLENVLDQLIYVGNNFPISQAEIGEAINNAGSALAANGNTLQEAIGILTAANASLQDVSKASTAVRTIAARISNSTAELEELGEDTGIYTTNVINAKMKELGVTVAFANGELRSTYDVLNDLAAKWGDLTDEQRASVANMLAGTRQQNAFYSIMSNWEEAKDVVAEESEGIGSLMDAQGTYIDSVEGRMQQLNATFESFSANVLKSDLVKIVIQALNGLTTALDWISNWFPTNEVLIGAFAMVMLTFGKRIVMGIGSWIAKLKEFKTTHDGVFKGLRENYQQAVQDINNTKAALESINNVQADSTLGQALSYTGLQTQDLTEMYASCNKQAGAMMEKLKETYNLTYDGAKAMVQWASESDRLTTKLNAASAAQLRYMQALISGIMTVAGIILSIANSTGNDIVKLCAGIVVAVGGIVTAIIVGIKTIDAAMKTNVIIASISLALSAIMMIVQAVKALVPSFENLKEKAKEAKDAWKDAKDELGEVKDKIKEVQEAIDELNAKGGLNLTEQADLDRLNQELEILKQQEAVAQEQATITENDAMNAAEKALDKYRSKYTIKDRDGNVIKDFDSRIADAFKNYRNNGARELALNTIQQYQELLSGFEYGMNEKLNSYFDDYYKLLDMYTSATDSAVSAWSKIISRVKYQDAVQSLKNFANTFTDTSKITGDSLKELAAQNGDVQELFDYLITVGMWDGQNWGDLTALVGDLRTELQELAAVSIVDDIEAITDKFESLSDALEDVAKNGVISLDTLQTLMGKYPSLLNKYFSRSLDGYKLAEEYDGLSNFDILQDMAVTSLEEYQNALRKAQKTLYGYTEDDKEYQDALEEVHKNFEGYAEDNEEYQAALSKVRNMLHPLTQDDDDYETALKNLATAQDNLNMKEIEWASLLRESKIDEETERLESLQDRLEEQLDVYKELIDIRKDLLETYKDEVDYQKTLAQKQKTVADLQTQLTLAQLDKTPTGQAKVRELESQLQKAQDELDEYTLEKAIEDITAALDSEYSEYESFIKEETEKISAKISTIATTLENILKGIDGLTSTQFTGAEMYDLYNELKQKRASGMSISGDAQEFMDRVLKGDYTSADQYYVGAKQAADSYKSPAPKAPEMTEDQKIAAEMTKIKGAWGQGIAKNNKGDNGEVILNGTTYHVESKGDDASLYKAAYEVNGYGDRDIFYYKGNLYGCLDRSIVKLGEQDGWGRFWNGVGNNNGWEALKRATGMYHTGGLVGDFSELKSNEEFAKLLKGEFVSTPKQMDDFMRKTLPAMVMRESGGGATINNNSPLVEINCGSVDDDTLPKLKDLVNQAVKQIEHNMESALHRTGYKKQF